MPPQRYQGNLWIDWGKPRSPNGKFLLSGWRLIIIRLHEVHDSNPGNCLVQWGHFELLFIRFVPNFRLEVHPEQSQQRKNLIPNGELTLDLRTSQGLLNEDQNRKRQRCPSIGDHDLPIEHSPHKRQSSSDRVNTHSKDKLISVKIAVNQNKHDHPRYHEELRKCCDCPHQPRN